MRASGILMHVTSLPGPNGIGAMGKPAHRFVDFLEQAGQKYWQVLPLSPTGYGDSPYQSFSAFAGNHYLIDLELLVDEGLLRREEVEAVSWSGQEDGWIMAFCMKTGGPVLYKAYERFLGMPNRAFHQFIQLPAGLAPGLCPLYGPEGGVPRQALGRNGLTVCVCASRGDGCLPGEAEV